MFCKNCGKEIGNNDVFCQHCGAEVNPSEVEANSNVTVSSAEGKKKGKFKIVIGVVVVVVIAIAALFILGNDEPQDIEIEAGDLAVVMNTDDEKQYYEDTLYVHGLLYRHPVDEGVYVLLQNENDENGVIFNYASVDEMLGDGSEVIVTGTLGYKEDNPSLTVLMATDIQVLNQEDRVYNVGTISELRGSSTEYVGKKVAVVGIVEMDIYDGGCWMWETSSDDSINLYGDIWEYPFETVAEWGAVTVIGTYGLDDYGGYITVEEVVE